MANGQNINPTDKESSESLRITALESKMITVQNQLTHTVTKADLQKAIAPLATKAELRDGLRDLAERTDKSIRELAERTDKSIRDLAERTDKSIRELRNHMDSMMRIIWMSITAMWVGIGAIAAVAALIIKFF